jgi:prepilin-type N-terminal cleavage/methylation domain-containing protein/prepilin-type processing-associated H-X9-DG protein
LASADDDDPGRISVKRTCQAFTLLELLVVISVITILAVISFAAFSRMRSMAQSAFCANSLRQLGAATQMYLGENNHVFFNYSTAVPGGKLWYFGFETSASLGAPEGSRTVDVTKSPLYPYVHNVGGVEVCPAFPYGQALWKPKYQGASWGYGFNIFLSGENSLRLAQPSQIIVFGDCAQINTFEAPASPNNPLLEEFYMVENTYTTIHFRHGAHANMLFLDGHVEQMLMSPGTLDTRLPSQNVGRITPLGSMQYLQ